MTPVITAIIAAALAGVIALYRERRLELARLLVAARVIRAVFLALGVESGSSARPTVQPSESCLRRRSACSTSGKLGPITGTFWPDTHEGRSGTSCRGL
jgi:hypothetical protein